MNITDTHTHLYSDAFDEDRDEVVQKSIDLGITRMFLPAIDSLSTQSMVDLQQKYPENVFLMSGLHPTHVKDNYEYELSHVEDLLSKNKYVAIGEIGIDLYWDKSTLGIQQYAFKRQIELALKWDLPIVIHCREAFDEVFEILELYKSDKLRGVFHCFTGSFEQAKKAISYNMLLGIGGVVTFKNGKIDQFLSQIDIKHIVLETDAPYLAPTPFRGKRNETPFIMQVLEKLATVYQESEHKIARITTDNSKRIFNV
jgi:TatD DNase family protein